MAPATEWRDGRQRWLTMEEAASCLGLPYQILADAVADHELAATNGHPARLGTWMVRLPVLIAWAAARNVTTTVPDRLLRVDPSPRR